VTRLISRATFFALTLLASVTAVEARDVYDDATLAEWQPRYQRSTERIFHEVILPALTVAEERALGEPPPIEFPLRAAGEWTRDYPLAFYVPGDRRVITMPIASLKFLDDICTAYAWLQINGYGLETVSEYTAILRFADKEPPGGFPPPLEALQIPANALDDPRVDELALGHFVTARTFLLAHELGHVLHRHAAHSYEQSRQNEREADRFAFQLMERTPLPPIGALLFFMADAHWSHVEENPNATHPMSGDRVRAAAQWVDDPDFAHQLGELGTFMDDPEIRAGFLATGKAGNFAALAPRQPGELPRLASARARSQHDDAHAFQGRYAGSMTQESDPAPIPLEVEFQRNGSQVRGLYTFGLGIGRIEGTVAGNRLDFAWEWAGNYGRGVLYAGDSDSFEGTWGYREASEGAGIWVGER
jgi:hypothetical protein